MMYDDKPYFSEYGKNVMSVVEDLCSISGGLLCGEQKHLQKRLSEVAMLPVFRGYSLVPDSEGDTATAENWKRRYHDAYMYEGKVYTARELERSLRAFTVHFDMLARNSYGEDYAKHLSIGVRELFYYKRNLDGVPDDYVADADGNVVRETNYIDNGTEDNAERDDAR